MKASDVMTKELKASEIRSGMKFWDGSTIKIKHETKFFIIADLSDGWMMEGKTIEKRWRKDSLIKIEESSVEERNEKRKKKKKTMFQILKKN